MCALAHINAAPKVHSSPATTFVLCLYESSFREQAFISWAIQNLHSEETDVLPGIFLLARWSEHTVRADKDNVSQQLRTTNKTAEPMRKVSEGDTAKNLRLPKEAVNSLSPGDPGRDPAAKDELRDGVPGHWLPRSSGHGSLHWAPLGLQEVVAKPLAWAELPSEWKTRSTLGR